MDYYIPQPPKESFATKQQDATAKIISETDVTYIIDHIELTNKGWQVYYKDIPFPRKGWPTSEGVIAINIVKRLLVEVVKGCSRAEMAIGTIFSILSPRRVKNLEKVLDSFNQIALKAVNDHILKPEYMTPLASELQGLVYAFLAYLGVDNDISKQTARIIGVIFEYDNAYRFRLQDIFTETTKGKLVTNPRKECRRLLDLYVSRDLCIYISDTVKKLFTFVSLALWLPSVKKAFIMSIENTEFERLQFDEADQYWVTNRPDYHFWGVPVEERIKDFEAPKGYTLK